MQNHHAQAQYSPRQLLESARRAEADGNIDLAAHVSRYVLEHFAGTPESAEAYSSLVRLGQAPREQGQAVPTSFSAANGLNGHAHAGYGQGAQPQAPVRHVAAAPAAPAASAWANPQTHAMMPAPAYAPAPSASGATMQNGFANGAAPYAPVARIAGPAPANMPAVAPANGGAYGAQMQTPVQTIAATFAPAAPYRGADPQPPAMIHHAPEVTPQYRGGRIVARLALGAGGTMMAAGVLSPLPALLGLVGTPSLMGMALVAGALIAIGLVALLGAQTALAVFDQADNMRELVELERTRWGT